MTTVLPADKFDTAMAFVKPDSAPARVPLDRLAVLPGFNTRTKDDDYNERVTTIAESIVTHGFFDDKPFAVTMLPGDDTIYIYDGEHRFDAVKQAILDGADFNEGLPVAFAKDGATVKDLTIHLAHGNNGERLSMVELAAVVRRMQGLGMDKPEIATALGRTTRHIDNLFVLAGASATVKKAVASGQIAGAEAVKLLRKDPKTAAAKITEAVKKAVEKGKVKATPKSMGDNQPTGPKMKVVAVEQSMPEGETMGEVLKALAKKIREHVQIGEGDLLTETGMIRVKIEVIDHEAEAAKVKAAEEKAAAAVKREEARAAAAVESAKLKAANLAKREEAAKVREAEKAKKAAEKKAAEIAQNKALAAAAKKVASGAKPASGVKAAKPPKTPAEAGSPKTAPEAQPTPAEVPAEAPAAESGAASDDGMGGL